MTMRGGWARVQPRTETAAPVTGVIHKLVEEGNLEKLQEALDHSPEGINALDAKGRTPLHVACEKGSLSIVRELIDNGVDCRVLTSDGFNPLHILAKATIKDDELLEDIVDALVDIGIELDSFPSPPGHLAGNTRKSTKTSLVETPVVIALQSNKVIASDPFIRILLKKGATAVNAQLQALKIIIAAEDLLEDIQKRRVEQREKLNDSSAQISELSQQTTSFRSRIAAIKR